jgi:hypothetical protein
MIQVRSNSDFDVKSATIQFYSNSHNSQSDRWHVVLSWVKISGQSEFGSTKAVRILLFTSFWLMVFLFGYDSFPKRMWQLILESTNSTKIFNGLQYSFQVWQRFIIISESFSYKDSLFILATKRKEDIIINSTIRSDFLVYSGLFNGDKSDSSIFRMVILGFLLLLLFSS